MTPYRDPPPPPAPQPADHGTPWDLVAWWVGFGLCLAVLVHC